MGLERLRDFKKAGGSVIFVGKTPKWVVDRTFKDAKDTPDLSFATLIEPAGDITPNVLAALPKPDVKLDTECPTCTYTHRSWKDGEMYFFFNEGNQRQAHNVTLAGQGFVQEWDLGTGAIRPLQSIASGAGVQFPLVLEPYETKTIVVGPLQPGVGPIENPMLNPTSLLDLNGDWTVDLNGKQLSTSLKSWEDLGAPAFAGPATYKKQFTAPAPQPGKRIYLEFASVRDYAKVKVNGHLLEPRAWQPYRWDITGSLKPGANDLEVEVRATAGGRGGGGRGGGSPQLSGLLGPARIVAN